MVDAVGISVGWDRLTSSAQGDYPNVQNIAVGAGATQTVPFSSLATVVTLRATVNCWFSVGGTAAAHVAGSDYLPANTTWMLKIPQGALLSFIQDSIAGWVSVTPAVNKYPNPTPGPLPLPTPPLDLIAGAAAAYGFRKLASAYAGKAMQVKRVSDNATQDIGFDVSGNFDVSGFNAFIGASSGTVAIWYDQSGGGNNLTPPSTAPAVNLTALNGHPAAVFAGGTSRLSHAATPTAAPPVTFSAVAARTGTFTTNCGILGDAGGTFYTGLYFSSTASRAVLYAHFFSTNVPCADSTAHSMIGIANSTSSTITIDGTTTGVGDPGAFSYQGVQISWLDITTALTGNVSEAIIWNSALSAGNVTTLAANQKAYWGTP